MAVTDEPVIPASIGERVADEVRDISARFSPPASLALGAEELRLLFEGVEDSVKRGLGEVGPRETNFGPALLIGAIFGATLALILFVSAFLLTRL